MVITRQLTDSASASTASDIQLGSCVTEIGQGAFSGYTNITDVEFPDSLTTIGAGAFSGSSITSVEFPSSVTTIGNSAFTRCNLEELTIPSGVTSIGYRAFMSNNSLGRINVSASTVPVLGGDAFGNTNDCTIYVPFDSYEDYMASQYWQEYRSRIYYNGMPFKVRFNTSNGEVSYVKCDGSTIVSAPSTMPSDITATTFGECVTDFATHAFEDKSLGNITIPSNVKYINGSAAFNNASATSISFSEGLEEIGGSSSFASFKCPQAITLPSTLSAMSNYAFANSSITGLTINGSPLLELNQNAFTGSSLNFINISNIKTVNGFRSCSNLETVTISNIEAIGFGSFRGCTNLKNFVLTSNKTVSIEDNAFERCESLSSISLSNVSSIGSSAFLMCRSLTSIDIPTGVTSIGDSTFQSCSSLSSVTIPSGVTSIGSYAFESCAFSSITLPNAVQTIGNYAFGNCPNLTSINIPSGVTTLNYFGECTSLSSITGCENVSNIVAGAFKGLSALQNFAMPSGITIINNNTFSGCTNLRNVNIPSGVRNIRANAFTNCSSMTTLIIPDSVIRIGNNAFSGCSGLNSILIGRATPPSIGTNVFADSYCLIYVPQSSYDLYVNAENWRTYSDRIFATGVDYKAMLIGGTNRIVTCNDNTTLALSEIGSNSAETINIGNCVTAIGNSAFTSSYSIQTVSIPSDVTSIGSYAFNGCKSLTNINIPSGVTSIGDYTFNNCSGLTSIDIPSGVTSIGRYAFNECNSLGGVTLPSTLTSIGNYAFYANLDYVKLKSATPPTFVLQFQGEENYAFGSTGSSIGYPIYVPCSSYEAYVTAWNYISTIKGRIVPFGDYTKTEEVVGEYLCENGNKYKKMEVFISSDNVTWCSVGYQIGDLIEESTSDCATFLHIEWNDSCGTNCEASGYSYTKVCGEATSTTVTSSDIPYASGNVSAVTLGDCVTTIGHYAFSNCSGLTSIDIPSGVTSIDYGAFYNCDSLTSVTIPDSVTSIGNNAFEDCSGLRSVTIGSGVTSFGGNVFRNCTKLKMVSINSNIGDSLFSNLGLTSVTIGNNVTRIGKQSFRHCSSLTSIDIPDSVTRIGNEVFEECYKLASVTVNATTPPVLGYDVFSLITSSGNIATYPIYVPSNSLEAYKVARKWSEYASRIQPIPNT